MSPHARSPNNIKTPLPGLEHLTTIRVLMSELVRVGVELLVRSCPELKKLELHAEARDFEESWFEPIIIATDFSSRRNTRQTRRDEEEINEINATRNFFSDLQDMDSTLASRRSARIWRESLTVEFLVTTRWYAAIQHLSGLQEAPLMLTQMSYPWEGHTLAEGNIFDLNLWVIRWVLLTSATRPKWERLDLSHLWENREGGSVSGQRLREGGGGEGDGEADVEGRSEGRGERHGEVECEGNCKEHG